MQKDLNLVEESPAADPFAATIDILQGTSARTGAKWRAERSTDFV